MNDNDVAGSGNNTHWFHTEASGFIGAGARHDKLAGRIAQRMRRKARPEQLISNSLFGLARHALTAALYVGLAYAAKLAFGLSLTFTAMR